MAIGGCGHDVHHLDVEFAAEEDVFTRAMKEAVCAPNDDNGPSCGDDPVGQLVDAAIAASIVDVALPPVPEVAELLEAQKEVFDAALLDSLGGLYIAHAGHAEGSNLLICFWFLSIATERPVDLLDSTFFGSANVAPRPFDPSTSALAGTL
jgi:hypothetical protein